jgi:hypothetical protein
VIIIFTVIGACDQKRSETTRTFKDVYKIVIINSIQIIQQWLIVGIGIISSRLFRFSFTYSAIDISKLFSWSLGSWVMSKIKDDTDNLGNIS